MSAFHFSCLVKQMRSTSILSAYHIRGISADLEPAIQTKLNLIWQRDRRVIFPDVGIFRNSGS